MKDINYSKFNSFAEKIFLWKKTYRRDTIIAQAFEIALAKYNGILASEMRKLNVNLIETDKFIIKLYPDGGIGIRLKNYVENVDK